MKKKIMELWHDPEGDPEEYIIELPEGTSKLDAAAHMFKATAEGLLEFQDMFRRLLNEGADNNG